MRLDAMPGRMMTMGDLKRKHRLYIHYSWLLETPFQPFFLVDKLKVIRLDRMMFPIWKRFNFLAKLGRVCVTALTRLKLLYRSVAPTLG